MADPQLVFDRAAHRRHLDRAAAGFADHDFLFREVAARLVERLGDMARDFTLAVDLGCRGGTVAAALAATDEPPALVQCGMSAAMVRLARAAGGGPCAVADEEALPFRAGCVDLVLSCLGLHWVNDLPGALLQIRQALKPDGLLLAAMLGGGTLAELSRALLTAEAEVTGGAGPRVSPFADIRDAGALLQRAGFALPVVDQDSIAVTYATAFDLMRELRGMGEADAGINRRRRATRRDVMLRAAEIYGETAADADGRIRATFNVIYMTGWAPHESQQRPLRPGSARDRLADALDATELPAGDKANPD